MGTHQENAKVFKALCDPKRLAILEQLRSGEKCACVLTDIQSVNRQIKIFSFAATDPWAHRCYIGERGERNGRGTGRISYLPA